MLQEFEGIIDASGLRALQQNAGKSLDLARSGDDRSVPFWAVLDTRYATEILRELRAGNPRRALLLLEERSFSLGTKTGGNQPRHAMGLNSQAASWY